MCKLRNDTILHVTLKYVVFKPLCCNVRRRVHVTLLMSIMMEHLETNTAAISADTRAVVNVYMQWRPENVALDGDSQWHTIEWSRRDLLDTGSRPSRTSHWADLQTKQIPRSYHPQGTQCEHFPCTVALLTSAVIFNGRLPSVTAVLCFDLVLVSSIVGCFLVCWCLSHENTDSMDVLAVTVSERWTYWSSWWGCYVDVLSQMQLLLAYNSVRYQWVCNKGCHVAL